MVNTHILYKLHIHQFMFGTGLNNSDSRRMNIHVFLVVASLPGRVHGRNLVIRELTPEQKTSAKIVKYNFKNMYCKIIQYLLNTCDSHMHGLDFLFLVVSLLFSPVEKINVLCSCKHLKQSIHLTYLHQNFNTLFMC